MRTLTFACSTLLFLPLLSLEALVNPVDQSQPESSVHSEVEINHQVENVSEDPSTFAADNTGWSNSNNEIEDVKLQLQNIRQRNFTPSRGVPSLTIANPYGFGSDRGFYSGLSYQFSNRNEGEDSDDATAGFGMGFGNAQKLVGAELSYTMASFGQTNRSFGSGAFNFKLHRHIGNGWGIAAGWNNFLSVGDGTDSDDSLYLSTTKILKLRDKVSSPFSRMAVTAGIGNGQFRTEDDINNDNNSFNPFGSVAFRVARPVSFVTEWTGQDLAMGLSASPFRTLPLTLNFGARDIAGAGDGVRFIFGIGTGF
ncbi:MAG: hypothetical protein ACFCAD_28585 [Pleurocapsa sp.]